MFEPPRRRCSRRHPALGLRGAPCSRCCPSIISTASTPTSLRSRTRTAIARLVVREPAADAAALPGRRGRCARGRRRPDDVDPGAQRLRRRARALSRRARGAADADGDFVAMSTLQTRCEIARRAPLQRCWIEIARRAPLQRCRIEARLKPRPTYVPGRGTANGLHRSVFFTPSRGLRCETASRTALRVLLRFACSGLLGVTLVACKKAEPEPAPVAPVQVAPAIKGSIRVIVTADAVLYPREQANIVPKVTAPVRRFLVNRGDHVKQGQLLAELENRDLVAAAQESRGQFAQAESNYRSTAGAGVPEEVTKA